MKILNEFTNKELQNEYTEVHTKYYQLVDGEEKLSASYALVKLIKEAQKRRIVLV